MTSACRAGWRSENGSIVTRSTSNSWRPDGPSTAPIRRTSASNAVGQSSSVPRSRPIRCRASGMETSPGPAVAG